MNNFSELYHNYFSNSNMLVHCLFHSTIYKIQIGICLDGQIWAVLRLCVMDHEIYIYLEREREREGGGGGERGGEERERERGGNRERERQTDRQTERERERERERDA